MSTPLPEPRPEVGQRPNIPMSDDAAEAEARRIIGDFATSFRDDSPLPAVGSTPPVAQPGRPPMSQAATDASGLMLAAGVSSLGVGGAISLVLVASGAADPVVVGVVCASPPVLLFALKSVLKTAKQEAAPTEVHHHYTGPVTQDHREVTNKARWFGRNTTNT